MDTLKDVTLRNEPFVIWTSETGKVGIYAYHNPQENYTFEPSEMVRLRARLHNQVDEICNIVEASMPVNHNLCQPVNGAPCTAASHPNDHRALRGRP